MYLKAEDAYIMAQDNLCKKHSKELSDIFECINESVNEGKFFVQVDRIIDIEVHQVLNNLGYSINLDCPIEETNLKTTIFWNKN